MEVNGKNNSEEKNQSNHSPFHGQMNEFIESVCIISRLTLQMFIFTLTQFHGLVVHVTGSKRMGSCSNQRRLPEHADTGLPNKQSCIR